MVAVRHLGFVGGNCGTTYEGPFTLAISCKNFVMIGNVACFILVVFFVSQITQLGARILDVAGELIQMLRVAVEALIMPTGPFFCNSVARNRPSCRSSMATGSKATITCYNRLANLLIIRKKKLTPELTIT